MSIIMYLGRNIKEYEEKSTEIIAQTLNGQHLLCAICLRPMSRHSSYQRGIRETGQKITIIVVWCSKCREWHALLPDFLLSNKHYSGDEIESVIIDSVSTPVSQIETEASESTVRRWIKQIGERIEKAVSKLKYHFGHDGQTVSEIEIDMGHSYSELEQILEQAPRIVKYSGNKLGLANIWLRSTDMVTYI